MTAPTTLAAEFLAPGRLWWLLAVALLAGAYVAAQVVRRQDVVRFTNLDLLDRVAPHRPGWRRHVLAAVQLAGLVAGVVAIARPVERELERTEAQGRVVVLFDVSLSMMATDVPPDRLQAAKEAAISFVGAVDDDVQLALVSFSGRARLIIPPTIDHPAVQRAIDGLQLGEGTAIGDALLVAVDTLLAGADPGDDPDRPPGVVVLLSDGETTVGTPTIEGAQAAANANVPVYTIAFGTEGGVVALPPDGQLVPVPVNVAELAAVAELTGGAAFEAPSATALQGAYEEIRDVLGVTLGEPVEIVTEHTWRWAMVALVLFGGAWALGLVWLRSMV